MTLPNIIVIILDTLRKDYGERYLDKILKEFGFVYYSNAIAPAPWTVPTHASLFTGLYPAFHEAHETKAKKMGRIKLHKTQILSSELKLEGYSTYLFSANILVTPYFGFEGFDNLILPKTGPLSILSPEESKELKNISNLNLTKKVYSLVNQGKYKLLFKGAVQKMILNRTFVLKLYGALRRWPLDLGISEAIKIVKSHKFKTPSFIFMNLMEMHEPYPTLLSHSKLNYCTLKNWAGDQNYKIIQKYKKGYNMEIMYLSKKLPELLKSLESNGLFENSLIIITSDHGQLLGEYGKINHGTFLYDELIKVPLWIKYPYEVEITCPEDRYISLTKLRKFIIGISKGKIDRDHILYSPVVFSEVYGTHLDYSQVNLSSEEKSRLEQLEKYRIAIYYKNFKGIFNVTDWKFEEIKSYDPNIEVTEDIVKHMKKEVIRFLKTATLAKVPKIKI